MQFEVDPMQETKEKGQKPHFWLIGSFKKAFLCFFLMIPGMGNMTAHLSRSFSIIKICNLKSIRYTKLKKMAKNLVFGYLDH